MVTLLDTNAGSGSPVVQNAALPITPRGMLLIRIHSIASNSASNSFAGTVAQLGEGVSRFNVNDRVLACSFVPSDANDKSNGNIFTEFALAEQDSICRVPDAMEFTDACSLATRLAAISQLSMPHGNSDNKTKTSTTTVLVSGGATPAGLLATQLLAMAGYTPLATCLPTSNELCQQFGAVSCFDSTSAACGADVRVHTDNGLLYALDCTADDVAMKMCYEALASSGSSWELAHYFGVKKADNAVAIKYTRRDVQTDWTLSGAKFAGGVKVLGSGGVEDSPVVTKVDLKTGAVHTTTELVEA